MFVTINQVRAQEQVEKMETDRPDQTEASTVVPKGILQIEAGYLFQKNRQNNIEYKTHAYPAALFRVGLLGRVELRVQSALKDSVIENSIRRKLKGLGPLSVGTKVKLWEEQGFRPEAALLLMVALPVGNSAFRPDKAEPQFRLALKNSLTETLDINYNLAYSWVEGNHEPAYSINLNNEFSDKFSVFIEAFGSKEEGEKAEHQADAGVLFFPLPNLQFNAAVGFSLYKAAPDYFITTGLAVRLPR
ncbi:transporter [Pontibacter silvestris]|nr:transporter [Pontibacter silvestris]